MQKYRIDVLSIIGDTCSCDISDCWHNSKCNINDFRCIQVDHINGNGNQDKITFSNNKEMFRYYKNHPDIAKENLQPLCANCNWIKRHKNQEYNRDNYGKNSMYKKCLVDTCKHFATGKRKFCDYHIKLIKFKN